MADKPGVAPPGPVELVVAELDGALGLADEPDVSQPGLDMLGLTALGFDARA